MNFDCLSPSEIRARYKQAEDKRYILDVLGDLTCSTPAEVAALLGVECPKRCPEYRYVKVTTRKPSTKINPELMRPLYDKGMSDSEIGAVLGYSRTSVGKWRRKEGLPCNTQPGSVVKHEALALYKKGYTDRQIAEALGVTKASVVGWRFRRGLPVNRPVSAKEACPA